MKKKLLAILLAAMLVAVMLPTALAADTTISFGTPRIYKDGAAADNALGIGTSGGDPVFVVPFTINNPQMDGDNAKALQNEDGYVSGYVGDSDYMVNSKNTGGYIWMTGTTHAYADELTISFEFNYGTGWISNYTTYTIDNDFWTNYMGKSQIIKSIKIDQITVYGERETTNWEPTVYVKITTDPASFAGTNDCDEIVATIQLVRDGKDVAGAVTNVNVDSNEELFYIGLGWADINVWDLRDTRVGDKLKITMTATDKNGFTVTSDAYTLDVTADLLAKVEVVFPDVAFGGVTVLNEDEAKDAGMLKAYEEIEGGMLYIPFEYFALKYWSTQYSAGTFDLTIATKDYSAVNQTGWKLSGINKNMESKKDSITGFYTYNQKVGLDYGTYFKDQDNTKANWAGKPFSAKAGDVWVITVSFEQFDMDFSYSYELTLTQSMVNVLTTGEGSVLLGDVNGDGVVNTKDASLILQDIVKLRTLTAEEKARALLLVSGSTEVSTKHASNILKLIVGLPIS